MNTVVEIAADSAFDITPKGLAVTGQPTFDQWLKVGEKILRMKGAIAWAIGDWINYGESRVDWGEKYDQALANTAYEYGTLRNFSSVAGAFELSRRYDELSWSHHSVVMPLEVPDQNELLAKAVSEKLTRDELRIMVNEIQGKPTPPEKIFSNCEVKLVDRDLVVRADNPGAVYALMFDHDLDLWRKLEAYRQSRPGKFLLSIAFRPDPAELAEGEAQP